MQLYCDLTHCILHNSFSQHIRQKLSLERISFISSIEKLINLVGEIRTFKGIRTPILRTCE